MSKIRIFIDDQELGEEQVRLVWPMLQEVNFISLDHPPFVEQVVEALAAGNRPIERIKRNPLDTKLCQVKVVLVAEREKSLFVEQPHSLRNGAVGIQKNVPRSLCKEWETVDKSSTGRPIILLTCAQWWAKKEGILVWEGER